MIELLQQLISIPSVSKDEGAACNFLQSYLSGLGMEVHRCGNNLWVESEPAGAKPTILLNAHIDTVKPVSSYSRDPFRPAVEGDRLYGLGSNDDGASLVALLETYRRLVAAGQPYRLVYSATAEEEVSGSGGLELVFPHIGRIDFGIIGEPTGMRMALAEKGLMVLDCKSSGKSGHAAREEGENAIYKAFSDIDWFRHYRFEKESEFCGPVKMTVTQIESGTQHNVIPDSCSFVVDVRSNGRYSNEEILEEVKRNVSCEVKARSTRLKGSFLEASHPAVERGLRMGLEGFGSPTLSNQALCGFPTMKIGPGDSSRSHTADEYVLVSELEKAPDIYFELLNGLKI